MNDYSQAGQTTFAWSLVHDVPERSFLDVGCAGLSISNTLGLEAEGFRGWLIDNSPEAKVASVHRPSPFILADAAALDYSFLPSIVSYLSLDVDSASLDALRRIFDTSKTTFRVITCEHDAYERGEVLRTPMIKLLTEHGYDILCADVCNGSLEYPFEIWAVCPHLVDMEVAERFRSLKPAIGQELVRV